MSTLHLGSYISVNTYLCLHMSKYKRTITLGM